MMACMMRMLKNIFLICGAVVSGLILLAAVCLIVLPYAASSTVFKDRLESILEDHLKHAVGLEKIDWSWRHGITVSGVTVGDHPDFSDENLAAVSRIGLEIDWIRLIRGRFVFDARIIGPRINIIRMADGRINIVDGFAGTDASVRPETKDHLEQGDRPPVTEAPREKETSPDETQTQKQAGSRSRPFSLPVDISGTFELTGFSLILDDREAGRHIAVTNADFRLDLPSIKTEAIRLTLHADLSVDHEPVPGCLVSITIFDLFDKAGGLALHQTAVESEIDLPGFSAVLTGDMKDAGIKSEISADLESLADIAYLFVPGLAEQMQPKGRLHLIAATSGMPDTLVSFDIRFSGDNLGFSGSVIGDRSLSSGSTRIHAAGAYDGREGNLVLDAGQIRLLENTGMEISGRISGLTSEDPFADATLTSIDIHIDEVVRFLKDFIPDMLQFPGDEGPSLFSVRDLVFSGGLKTGPANAACRQIALALPRLIIAPPDKTERISISGGRIEISGIESDLTMFFPVSAALTAGIRIDAFELASRDRSVSIRNVNLNELTIRGNNIQTAPNSPFGVAGVFTMTESLDAGSFSVAPLLRIEQMRQTMDVRIALDPDGILNAALDGLHLNIGHAVITPADRKTLALGCRLDAAVPEFTLKGLDPVSIDFSGFQTELALDNALSLIIRAEAADAGRSMIRCLAGLNADLDLLTQKAKDFIGPDIVGGGKLDLTLNMDGRLPDENVMAGLAAMKLDGNLDFISSLAINALLTDGRLGIGPDEKNRVHISGISGDPLLSYLLKGPSGNGKLACVLRMENIHGIAGMAPRFPLSVSLGLHAAHRYLSAIDLDQRINIDPISVQQALVVSVDGLDRLLSSGRMNAPYAALSRVGAEVSAEIDIKDLSQLEPLEINGMPDMNLDGALSVRTGLHLIPGNRITGDFRVALEHANLNLKDMLAVANADADIDFFKTYKLSIIDPARPDRSMELNLLSQRVLEPETTGTALSGVSTNGIYRHMKQLKERTNPSSEISFDSIALRKGPLPINVGASRILMDMVDGLPGINFFQFDLLGGAVNGSINLVKGSTGFRVQSALNFSGVNTAAFFPELFSGGNDPRAEIRGMVYADIPVTHQMPVLLENMAFSIEFTKIGSRAIDRLLYSLDPYESNEAVMAQRRILKNGSPKWIRINIRDGFLSILGEVTIRTLTIPLPSIQRLNIARLPGIENFAAALGPLETAAVLLGRISAETLAISQDGQMARFK